MDTIAGRWRPGSGVITMLVVIAVGTSVLKPDGTEEEHERALRRAARAIAEVARDNRVVVVHGGGGHSDRMVGTLDLPVILRRLDVLDAAVAGIVGYRFDQLLRNELPSRPVATLLTEVLVDPDDAEFAAPSRPVGPPLDEAVARRLAAELGWTVAVDGRAWRRLVPSPEPTDVLSLAAIRHLVLSDVLVVCGGGGGVPVIVDGRGQFHGVAAIIDKDLTAALVAQRLTADRLLFLTDVDGVHERWGAAPGGPLRSLDLVRARGLDLDSASMGVKVEAACRFAERGGGMAAIGRPEDIGGLLAGTAGTTVAVAPGQAGGDLRPTPR